MQKLPVTYRQTFAEAAVVPQTNSEPEELQPFLLPPFRVLHVLLVFPGTCRDLYPYHDPGPTRDCHNVYLSNLPHPIYPALHDPAHRFVQATSPVRAYAHAPTTHGRGPRSFP